MNKKILYEEIIALEENRQDNILLENNVNAVKETLDKLLVAYRNTTFPDQTKSSLQATNLSSELITIQNKLSDLIINMENFFFFFNLFRTIRKI